MRTNLVYVLGSLLLAGTFAGCSSGSSSSSKDGGSGDENVPPDDGDVPFTNGTSTLAGQAMAGDVDGPRVSSLFSDPVNVLYDNGTVYVADFDNGKLRAIDADTHNTTTLIAQQNFARPFAMVLAPDGTLFVSTDNDPNGGHTAMSGTIWKVDTSAKTATVVAASIGRPRGIAVMADGKLAVADYMHHVVEIVDPTTGTATTLAGTWDGPGMVDGAGTAAKFSTPYSVVINTDGSLLVTDFDNNRVRAVQMDGTTSTLAGTSVAGFVDGAMASAQFSHPQGMSITSSGDIYVTDLGNFRIRRLRGTNVDTVAGDGMAGHVDNDNPLLSEIYGLEGLSVVPDGSMVYVADGNRGEAVPYNFIRQVKLN